MRTSLVSLLWVVFAPVGLIHGALLDFESIQLGADHIDDFPDVDFGDFNARTRRGPECRSFPGNDDWPTELEWRRLNTTLGGALLRPTPLAAVCYRGGPVSNYDFAKCDY